MSYGAPRPGPSGPRSIPIRSTKTIKKITPSETSITSTTTTRLPMPQARPGPSRIAGPSGSSQFQSKLKPPKTLYATPVTSCDVSSGSGLKKTNTTVTTGGITSKTYSTSKGQTRGLPQPSAMSNVTKNVKTTTSTTSMVVGNKLVTDTTKKTMVFPTRRAGTISRESSTASVCPGAMRPGVSTSSSSSMKQSYAPSPGRSRIGQVSKRGLGGQTLLGDKTKAMTKKKEVQTLEDEVEEKLLEESARVPNKNLTATGARTLMTTPAFITTASGSVPAKSQVISSKTVIRSPGQPEIVSRQLVGVESVSCNKALRTEVDVQKLQGKTRDTVNVPSREVITVISNVLISAGVKQTIKTVTYDTAEGASPTGRGASGGGGGGGGVPSPLEVSMMVEEECQDIEKTRALVIPKIIISRPTTYGLQKDVSMVQLNPDSVSNLENSIVYPATTPDQEQEEAQPEIIASILNTEERGLAMGSPPGDVYEYLFNEVKYDPAMDVCPVMPAPLSDVVFPLDMPNMVIDFQYDPSVIQAGLKVETSVAELPKDSIYIETVGKDKIQSKNVAKRGKRKKQTPILMLSQEIPPWGIQDLEPVVDLVGADPAGTMLASLREDTPIELNPCEDGIEYMLQMEPPKHTSRVQLRGSQKPAWFPGYMIALPEIPDLIKVVQSPSTVFHAAWKATQPDIFNDHSLFIV